MKKPIQTVEFLSKQLTMLGEERDALISKLKQYEHLATKEHVLISQYVENIDGAVYQLSLDLDKFLYLNRAAEKLWQQPRESLYKSPLNWFESIHPEDRAATHKSILNMIKDNKKNLLLEYRLTNPDSSITYISDRVVLVKDKEDKPYCIMGIAIDITRFVSSRRNLLIYDQILNTIEHETSIELISDIVLKIICNSFNWDEAEIWLLDEAKGSLYCIKIWHKLADEIKEFYEESFKLRIKSDSGFQGQIIQNNFPTLVTNFTEHTEFFRGKAAAKANLNTALGLPISFQNKIVGVLIFFSREVKHASQNDIQLIQRVSDILGHFIQNNIKDKRLSYITQHDELTGLLNQAGFESALQNIIDESKPKILALICLSIDRFKKVNEMGFDISNQLLREVAFKLRDTCDAKIIANFGGGQFMIVPDTIKSAEQIQLLIERLMAIFKMPLYIKDMEIFTTASIGVSVYPYDGLDNYTLLKNVEIALYHARSQGGNTIQFFTETLQKTVTNVALIETGLRHAIAENQLRLFYQPKVDLKTGNIIGVEALVRWQDPDDGLRLPSSFINIAEESDLIVYVGEWVLLEVCYHFPLLSLQIPVSINFSAIQLKKQYDIVRFITHLIEKLSIPPYLLEIEVTESILMQDVERSLEVLIALKNMGISIAFDDFGTGYGSFEYLKRFKVNRIKIDKSFIDPLPTDPTSLAIVRAMIAMAHALDVKVIAEGVETAEQVKILMAEGCDEIQGYYFSKPLPLYELNNLIVNSTKLKFPD